MRKILTIELLDDLISRGYRYCLSRTIIILGEDADTCITLLPVKQRPRVKKLLMVYDTFFKLTEEPREMAKGVDETIILVDLSTINLYEPVSL